MNKGTVILLVIVLLLMVTLGVALLRGGSMAALPPPPATAPGEPLAMEEVVAGKLGVRVYSHVIRTQAGELPCWTYVSDGLGALGQDEIVFSVKREPNEAEGLRRLDR